MNKVTEEELKEIVNRYKEIRNQLLRARQEEKEFELEKLFSFMDLQEELFKAVRGFGLLQIKDPSLKRDIDEIRQYFEGWTPDNFFSYWEHYHEYMDGLSIDPFRLLEIETPIVSLSTSTKLSSLLFEVERCYCFGLFNSTVVFCRSILETEIKNTLESKNIPFKKRNGYCLQLNKLIELCFKKELLSDEEKERADKIRECANKILHEGEFCSEEERKNAIEERKYVIEKTKDVIKDTFQLIEILDKKRVSQ